MKKILFAVAGLALAVCAGSPAYAQATRTWVSGLGDDANPCSRTAPCKTFASTLTKTAANGEINCLDAGGYGNVTITKSITIDCTGVLSSILNSGGATGVTINASGITVTLRNITLDGAGTGNVGVNVVLASKVNLENVEVYGNTQQGVRYGSTDANSMLVIKDSTIRNNALAGISAVAASGSAVLLENVVSMHNQFGLAVGTGNVAIASRSTFSNGSTAGVEADTGGQIYVNDSTINNSGTGVQIAGTATLANTSVVFNATGFGGGGTINTFGNNRVVGNTTVGQALVAVGTASSDLGQK